ncbi:MAG: HAD hydrolase-like protein [SAR324 cluster bacterium]|nr:HAD hydrolase-like protein [SAR324 cluster bacterium]
MFSKKLHLFDLDDTLIETRPVYQKAQEIAIQMVFPHLTPAELAPRFKKIKFISKAFGSGLVEQYFSAFLVEEIAMSIPEKQVALTDLVRIYYEKYWPAIKAKPGAKEWLRSLQAKGLYIGLISNGNVELQKKKLALTGLEGFFPESVQWISGAYAPEFKKPSTHMFEEALAHFCLKKEEAVYYGNITADMLGANLSGMSSYLMGKVEDGLEQIAIADKTFTNWCDLTQEGEKC